MSEQHQVTIQQAYQEACTALGEALVEKRLLAKAAGEEINALTAERDALTPQVEPDPKDTKSK